MVRCYELTCVLVLIVSQYFTQDGIFSLVSAVLWLSNIGFKDIDGESVELTSSDSSGAHTLSGLLGIEYDDVCKCLTTRNIVVRGQATEIPLKIKDARENRNVS